MAFGLNRVELIDDGVGHRFERVVLAMDMSARPERAGLAQRVLDVEAELVLRDRVKIVVHAQA